MKIIKGLMVVALALVIGSVAFAMDDYHQKHKKGLMQTTCPVMGGKINKKYHVDVDGKRIYVCCPACINRIKSDPEKYIKALEEKGIVLESVAQMGEKHGDHHGGHDEHRHHNH